MNQTHKLILVSVILILGTITVILDSGNVAGNAMIGAGIVLATVAMNKSYVPRDREGEQ